jgi:lysophospholipase L1-like esterase
MIVARFLTAVVALIAVGTPTGAFAAPPDDRSTAVVALGDSLGSGESAGQYEPGTDQAGNFCHRSALSETATAPLAGVTKRINLACSGATTGNVRLGGVPRYGEAPQAERLRQVARDNRITAVVLTVGANDLDFAGLVVDCVRGYLLLGRRCQDVWTPGLAGKLAALAPRVAGSVADVRSVLRDAGYADGDYQLVVQSYPPPVSEQNRYLLTKALHGCPIRNDDALWTRTVLAPAIAATLGEVATAGGARFLDLSQATYGHEVCARGIEPSQEWVTGIRIDLGALRNGLGPQLFQESLHPNAAGHAQLGRCLAGFIATTDPAGRCVAGTDGNLTAVAIAPPHTAAPHTLPVAPEPPPQA